MSGLLGAIEQVIERATGRPFSAAQRREAAGGCINAAAVISDAEGVSYFVKLNAADTREMFEAEAEGLRELAAGDGPRVPRPVGVGQADGRAFLVLEHLRLGGRGDAARAGQALARLHRRTRSRFGWHRDNTIGATPQLNTPDEDWVRFFRERRLAYQLELAARNGHRGSLQHSGERLLGRIEAFFGDSRPAASLLHGDLWGGNHAYDERGEPVVYDPAVYFGDREADLAMTELFGGFPREFYSGYESLWPLEPGYAVRRTLYNLYHVLNHLNLFGGGYRGQAEHMIARLLAEVG